MIKKKKKKRKNSSRETGTWHGKSFYGSAGMRRKEQERNLEWEGGKSHEREWK